MKINAIFILILTSLLSKTMCNAQSSYYMEEAYDPVKLEAGNVNGGILIGVPIDTSRLEYGVRINYSLNETVQIVGAFNWTPNYETAGYEIELTIKYVFSA